MKIRRVHWWLVAALTVVCVASFLPETGISGLPTIGLSGKITRRARLRCGLPAEYSFRQNRVVNGVVNGNRTVSDAATRQVVSRRVGAPDILRKTFSFSNGISVDDIQLNRIGVSLYNTGAIVATGIIQATQNDAADRVNNDVTIHLRAYGGTAAPALQPNGPILCESKVSFWLQPNRPIAVSLTPLRHSPNIARHFDEITHIEVRLEHKLPRTTAAETVNP